MICPSCSYKNANEHVRLCEACGEPLHMRPQLRGEPPPGTLSSAQIHFRARQTSSRWLVASSLFVCVALAGTGVAISGRSAALIPSARTTQPLYAQHSPSSSTGTDLAALDYGGEIESVTGSYGPGHNGHYLIDGSTDPAWAPDRDVTYPQEIVFSFYHREEALVSALVFSFTDQIRDRPKDVEIWTSLSSPSDGFSLAKKVTLDPTKVVETVSLQPLKTRYVKVRVLTGVDPNALEIGEIAVIEGSSPGYLPLIKRFPEISKWKGSVRYAAQQGIDWLEPATIDWQRSSNCFGCHVQAQVLMGLAVAKANGYVVSDSFLRDIADFTRAKQRPDGTEDFNESAVVSPTQYVSLGLAYFDQSADSPLKTDTAFLKATDWLLAHQDAAGSFTPDWDEPPISQGTFMPTANAVAAFKFAFADMRNARYDAAADKALAYIGKTEPETTQDEVYKIIALSQFGNPEQRQLVPQLVQTLLSQQLQDGGWRESSTQKGANALATGEVLYCLKQAGVSVASKEFTAGVRYLMQSQDPSGSWPSSNSVSTRPSDFAPTMWAVIGLAGSFADIEEPTEQSIKAELDKHGRVVLYINFDFNKATIRPDGKPIIAQVVKLLDDYKTLQLSIGGYTDNIGTYDYNIKLSTERAAAVVDALASAGVARTRLSSAGYGPNSPIADNKTEKGRAKNRRVELVKE
jgi:outer membrane protein OmpA-like peptidoglycan-associated protein